MHPCRITSKHSSRIVVDANFCASPVVAPRRLRCKPAAPTLHCTVVSLAYPDLAFPCLPQLATSEEFSEHGICRSIELKSLFVCQAAKNSGRGLGSALLQVWLLPPKVGIVTRVQCAISHTESVRIETPGLRFAASIVHVVIGACKELSNLYWFHRTKFLKLPANTGKRAGTANRRRTANHATQRLFADLRVREDGWENVHVTVSQDRLQSLCFFLKNGFAMEKRFEGR